MSFQLSAPQPLLAVHRVDEFACGEVLLDEWLKRRALANQLSGASRTFVVAANDSVFTILALDVMAELMGHGNPALRMAVVPAYDAGLVERMARGEVDLFLGDVDKVPDTLKARALLSDIAGVALVEQ